MKIKTFLAAHSIISILLTICFAGIFYLLIGHLIFPLIFNDNTPNAIKFIGNRGLDILFAAISILISHKIYKNKIGFRKRNFLRGIFSIGIILTVLYTIKMISWFYLFKVSNSLSTIIINFLLCAAAAFCTALYEESFCRGLLFNSLLKANKKKSYNGMIFSVICTSFIFAALHFIPFQTNITLSFIPLFCFSFYLTAVYIRCENIWVPVFFHGINNLYVYFPNIFISSVVTNTYNTSTNIVNICLNLVLTAVIPLCTGIFLLRKNKLAKEKRI